MGQKNARLLTETELEIMHVVWRKEPCVVRDVLAALPEGRDVVYTSVAKIMSILEEKGFLRSKKSERTHVFSAAVSREEYESRSLQHLKNKMFEGSSLSLVQRLLNENELTSGELAEIRRLLDAKAPQ